MWSALPEVKKEWKKKLNGPELQKTEQKKCCGLAVFGVQFVSKKLNCFMYLFFGERDR